MKPVVAIVGRPNVGKSKLFNYIVGKKISIVEDTPGVTRDRIISTANWQNKYFDLVDTAGVERVDGDYIKNEMQRQTKIAMDIADVIIFLTDLKTGVTSQDMDIAKDLRKFNKKIVLCVNKCDKLGYTDPGFYEFYNLGMGGPIGISAANATGIGDLLEEVTKDFKSNEDELETEIRVAIIGKPNAGKSSLINKLLNENRSIVSDVAGTTRDAIDCPLTNEYGKYIFVDTAGVRKKSKVDERLEKFSVIRTELAIERSDVCIVMIDALEGVSEQDTKILGLAHNLGKGIIIAINKWDLVEKSNNTMNEYTKTVRNKLKYAQYADIVYISAITGQRVNSLFENINKVYANNRREITTSNVNKIIEESIALSQVPSDKGRKLKIYYGTQSGINPPTFTLFVNDKELFHFSYQRYIINNFRKAFDFSGTTIKLNIKERKEKEC